jgi:hypothetical protein
LFSIKVNKERNLTITKPSFGDSVKRRNPQLLFVIFIAALLVSGSFASSPVYAQNSNYSITQVDHQIQVMYSGHVVVLDTVHVAGQVSDGFMIGLPFSFSDDVLKGFAYDNDHVYQLNLGVQLGNQTGFYGAEVNFNGYTPETFTVAFVLSNRLITQLSNGSFLLDFPAYPSLTKNIANCNVELLFPSSPHRLNIAKDDGEVNQAIYSVANLPAYRYSIGKATFNVPTGTLQLVTISNLNRDVTIDPTGTVTVGETYQMTNNASLLSSFVFSLPVEAKNIAVTDEFNRPIPLALGASANGDMTLANVTLVSLLTGNQSTSLNINYNMNAANLQQSNYILPYFDAFPRLAYLVNQASLTFNLPEGATITSPTAETLDSFSTLTRQTYQDTLSIKQSDFSFVDYLAHQQNSLDFAFTYNPVWVSIRPTFLVAFAAVICCLGAVVYQRRKPKEETYKARSERLAQQQGTQIPEAKAGQQVTIENIREFVSTYSIKLQLNAELRSLEHKAQKNRITRRQYRVQKQTVETRLQGIESSISRLKPLFLNSSGSYGDYIRQLDLAQEDLDKAYRDIQNLEELQNKGQISVETYKKSLIEYQKRRDKADSAINGILNRLREKIPKKT